MNDPDALVVKFQTIVRDGKEIVVGRLKVATVSPQEEPSLQHLFVDLACSSITIIPLFAALCVSETLSISYMSGSPGSERTRFHPPSI